MVTEAETFFPQRVLVHSIGLGGFYYAAAAFEGVEDLAAMETGRIRVKWSEGSHAVFRPADVFQRPLSPWTPRAD